MLHIHIEYLEDWLILCADVLSRLPLPDCENTPGEITLAINMLVLGCVSIGESQ